MRKVINGKRYDTSTAKRLAERDNGNFTSNLDLVVETLYRTKSGNFFIHGEGGARTIYGKWVADNQVGGEQIVPISLDGAKEWAEKHLDGNEYEEIFTVEDTVKFSADLSQPDKEKFDELKKELGLSAGELISRLMADYK